MHVICTKKNQPQLRGWFFSFYPLYKSYILVSITYKTSFPIFIGTGCFRYACLPQAWLKQGRVFEDETGEVLLVREDTYQGVVQQHPQILTDRVFRKKIINIIEHFSDWLPKKKLYRWSGVKPQQFYAWRRNTCKTSLLQICRLRHPAQLTYQEVKTILSYLKGYLPGLKTKTAVYAKMVRDGKAFMSEKTFYNYSRLLGYVNTSFRKKKRKRGIRAVRPKQILHMDVTQYKLADNTKAYIYFIQDNFSRKILNWKISRSCNSAIAKENLQEVCDRYSLLDEQRIDLIVDGGIKNKGEVMTYLKNQSTIKLRVALKDIQQSNSMIEAANRCIKHFHLFPHDITSYRQLVKLMPQIIDEYNNKRYRPSLGFRSPSEAFEEIDIGLNQIQQQMEKTKRKRCLVNSQFACNKHCN